MKRQITDSISENSTDSDLERTVIVDKTPVLYFEVKKIAELLLNEVNIRSLLSPDTFTKF